MTERPTDRGPGSSRQRTARSIGLIVLGVVLVLVGMVAWGWETEYGSGNDSMIEVDAITDVAKVYDLDEQAGTRELVFEGTTAEAQAYAEEQRTSGRNYMIPALILAAGGALILLGVWPRRTRYEAPPAMTAEAGP